MAKKDVDERVKPIILTDTESGDKFTLEYSRESVKFAESRGFKVDDVATYPMTKIPEMFYYAFRKNHRNVSRQKTDKLFFEGLGGHSNLPDGFVERLFALYTAPFDATDDRDGEEKNLTLTVEM